MQIDLLITKMKRYAIVTEGSFFHPKAGRVKHGNIIDVGNG
jgi:hypothetical protein